MKNPGGPPQPQQKDPGQMSLEGMDSFTPDVVRRNLRQKRIFPEDQKFQALYGGKCLSDRLALAKRVETFDKQESKGELTEALVFTLIEKGVLGKRIQARVTSEFDDVMKGEDIVLESRQTSLAEPIVSAIDVTQAQENIIRDPNIKNTSGEYGALFSEKVKRIVRHVEFLKNLSREDAVELSGWLQSGGLSKKYEPGVNEDKFNQAEELIVLKYYENPDFAAEPYKPRFVINGPQIVLSLDEMFTNKVFNSKGEKQQEAVREMSAVIQIEVAMAIALLRAYLDKVALELKKEGKGNLFFDSYHAACIAWEHTFSSEEYEAKLQEAMSLAKRNPDIKAQVTYFQETIAREYNLL